MYTRDPTLISQLRPGYIIGFIVLWMINGMIGSQLNGGLGQIRTVGAAVGMSMAGVLISAFAGGPLYSSRLRRWALRDGVTIPDVRLKLIGYTLFGIMFIASGAVRIFELQGAG